MNIAELLTPYLEDLIKNPLTKKDEVLMNRAKKKIKDSPDRVRDSYKNLGCAEDDFFKELEKELKNVDNN